jgi:hypothetical protein
MALDLSKGVLKPEIGAVKIVLGALSLDRRIRDRKRLGNIE